MPQISLVIPVFNEEGSIHDLIRSIGEQSLVPDEVIMVDGGSTDRTVPIIREHAVKDNRFRVVEAGRAMPGRGRNIGSENAGMEWIAYTDAGIRLAPDWLERLVENSGDKVDIVYGNFTPVTDTLFTKCAAIAYAAPLKPGRIRDKFIASSLFRKKVWVATGGFPDLRAAEDLMFMEKAEQMGFRHATAPDAMVYWQLRPDFASTFRRFDLYSKYNVWGGRQAFWHYGVARQYLFMLIPLLLGFLHHWLWFLAIPAWFAARVTKRFYQHRHQFGIGAMFNPIAFLTVLCLTLVIDMATFSGWIKAIIEKRGPQAAVRAA